MAEEQKLGTLWFGAEVRLDELKKQIKEGNQDILNALTLSIDDKTAKQMIQNLQNALNSHPVDVKLNVNGKSITDSIGQLEKALSAGSISELGVFENRVNSIRQKIKELQEQMDALPRNKSGKLLLAGDEERLKTMTAQMKELQSQEAVAVANLTGAQKRYSDALEVTRVNAENVARAVQQINQAEQKGGTQQGGVLDTQKFKTLQEAIDKIIGEINRLQQAFTHLGENSSLSNLSTMINGLAVTLSSLSNAIKIQPLDEQVKALLDRCEKAEAKLREVGDAARYLNERAGAKTQQKAANIADIAGINDKATVSLEKYSKLLYDVENALYRLNNISAAGGSKLLNQPIEQLEQMRKMLNELGVKGENGRIIDTLLSESDYAKIRELFNAIKTGYKDVASESDRYTKSKQNGAAATSHLSEEERKLASAIKSSTDSMRGQSQILSDLKTLATQYLGVWGSQAFIHNIIEIGGQLEMQRLSIGAILGDMAKADDLFGKIKNLAIKSPFGVVELDQMTKQLSAYGFEYNELFDMTKRLADISAATGTSVDRLALALGHVRSEAALSGYTLRQFSMANIPLAKKLSEHLTEVEGKLVSIADVRKRVRSKDIGYQEVLDVLKELTDEGGMFYNAQEIMSESVKAKFKNLKDSMDIMYGEMADSFVGKSLKEIASLLTTLTRHWQELGAVLVTGAGYWMLTRTSMSAVSKAMVEGNIAAGKFSAAQLEMAAHTGNLTKQMLLQAVATHKLSVADAEAAANVFLLSKAQLQHVANTGKVASAMNMATVATSKYTVAQLRLFAMMRNLSLFNLAGFFNGIWSGAKAATAALVGLGKSLLPLLAISAVVEIFTSLKREQEEYAESANYVGQQARNMMKDIDEAVKSVESGGKPVDTEALRDAVKTMQQVVEQSEFYTAEQQKQVDGAKTLSDKYDVLLKQLHDMREEATFLANSEDLINDILKNTGRNVVTNDSETYNAETGQYEKRKRLGTEFFNDNIKENLEQVNKANSELQTAIQLMAEYQGVMDEAIKKNNGFGLSLDGKSWQEQIRLIAESGHWDEFIASVENAGSRFEKQADKVKKASDNVRDKWDEIVNDDFQAIKLTLMDHFNMTEQELDNWAKNNEKTVRWMVDGVVKAMSKFGIAEAVLDSLKQKILNFFNYGSNGKPNTKEPSVYDLQTELGKKIIGNVLKHNKATGKGKEYNLSVKDVNAITGTGEGEKTVSEVVKAIKEKAKKDYQVLKDTEKIYDKSSKEYAAAKKKYDYSLNLAEANGIERSEIEKDSKKKAAAKKKAESEAEKAAKAKTKQEEARLKIEEELAKQRLELQDAIADAEVAAIENNAERERAQRKVEFEKQKRQLDRQVEEWKRKSFELAKKEHEANPKNKTISFFDTEEGKAGWQGQKLTPEQVAIDKAQRQALVDNEKRRIKEENEALIASHADYIDKKIALDKKYNETFDKLLAARDKAEKEGDKKTVEAMTRTMVKVSYDKAKEQAQLSLEQLKEMPDYVRAFEDLDNTSTETLEFLIKEFEKVKGAAAKNLDPKDLKEFTDALQRMQDKVSERNPFKGFIDSTKELKAANKEVEAAKKQLELVKAGGLVYSDKTEVIDGKVFQKVMDVAEAEEIYRKALDKRRKATRKSNKELGEALDKVDELNNAIKNLGDSIGGEAGEIISLIGDIGTFATSVINAVNFTAKGTSAAIRAVEKASVILAIASAALQIIQKITSLFGADYEQYDAMKAQYENLIDVWDQLIDKKKEYINIKYSSEVIQAGKEAIELLNKETEAWRELGKERLNSGASMGSHSIGVRSIDNMNASDWEKVARSLGRSTDNWAGLGGRLTGLFDLTTEQLAKLKQDAPAFWSKLDEDVREYLDHIIEGAETLKEIEESVQTKIIGKSKTEFIDDFMDSLYDLANGADDVFDDVEESWRQMLNKMVIDNLIAKHLSEELEAIYKKIYELQKRKNSGDTYSAEKYASERNALEEELNYLKSEYEWLKNYEGLASIVGRDDKLENLSRQIEDLEKKLKALNEAEELAKQGLTDEEYEAELRKIYEELDGVWASYEAMIEDFQKRGLLNNVVGETIFGIDAIKDAFKSLVTDTELDMEKWGQNLKNSMIESLIEAMVFGDEFKEWLKGLKESFNEAWKSYKETGDRDALNAFLTSVTTDIDNMGDDIAEKIKELKEALGYFLEGEEGDNPFSGLRDSFLDTLTNMEDDAEAFRKRLTEIMVKDMIDKNVLGTAFKMDEYFDLDSGEKIEKVFENFDKYLEDWNERYKKAVESGNQDLIDALIDELVRAREITIEAAEQWRDKIKEVTKDTTFSDMSDSWVSTLMDMSKTAEDWAENVGKIMAEQIIKQMVVPTYIQPLLDELQDVFNKVMEDATSTDENGKKVYDWESVIGSEELQAQLEIMKKKFPELQAIIKQIMDSLGLDTSNYKYSGFSNLGDSILESLKSSEGSLEDWAKSMGQQMAEDMAKAYIDATYGKDIDDLNKAWQKALQEGKTAAMKDIEDQLSALYGKMADDPELQRLIDKFRELAENPFKDMASDFASSLMDMEQSAEDFANNIAKNLTQEMITKVIKDQYQGEIDALGEQWKAALEAGDSAAIERIRQQLEMLYGQMGDAVKPLLDAISDIGKETDKTFSSMTDSWVSALMDMEGTAEDFAQTVGKTMAQKIITEMIAPTYIQPILDAMQKAYNLAIAAPGATISSVLAQMTPFIGQIEDVYRQIQPIIQEIFGTIGIVADSVEEAAEEVEYALGDMKSNFVSALMDMTNSAEDFSKDISKIMAQTFIEKFVLGEQFDRQMEYWQQQYESIIGSGMSEDERKRQLKALRDTIVAAKEGYVNEAMAIQELFGLTTEDNQTATMNMADKITYDQADQLLGINLAQELTLEQILATLQGKDIVSVGGSGMTWQSASGAQNDEQSRLINATLTNFAQMTQQNHDNILTQVAMANSHLQMIRDYSKKICDQVELHMESMDDKLSHLRNW